MKPRTVVLLAAAAIAVGVGLRLVHSHVILQQRDWQMSLVLSVLAVAVVVGLVRKHRFSWQTGRILAMVAGAFMIVYGAMGMFTQRLGSDSTQQGLWLLASGLLFAAAAALLHTRPVRQHMDLICPKCGTPTSRPANLAFSEARCRNSNCNHKW